MCQPDEVPPYHTLAKALDTAERNYSKLVSIRRLMVYLLDWYAACGIDR